MSLRPRNKNKNTGSNVSIRMKTSRIWFVCQSKKKKKKKITLFSESKEFRKYVYLKV